MKTKTIILGITGGIAAYKSCDIISALKKKGHEVICIMTAEAEKFITPLTLETLSQNKVHKDMFELPDKRDIAHISLGKLADIIAICPATANFIAKLASGICDDLLSCTIISSTSPVMIAPAMNENMYKHKITQKNILELKKIGFQFIEPIRGRLACGTVGIGHLAEPAQIVNRIDKILKKT